MLNPTWFRAVPIFRQQDPEFDLEVPFSQTVEGDLYSLLTEYKGFKVFRHLHENSIYLSCADGICFETDDGRDRWLATEPQFEKDELAIARAQEAIDALVLASPSDGQIELNLWGDLH